MNDRGVSLMEVIVVTAIIGIVIVMAGIEVSGLLKRYGVESQIKELFGDLMAAKMRALERNRSVFVVPVSTVQYAIYEDTNPAPDGNGTFETGSDTLVVQRTVKYEMVTTDLSPSSSYLTFSSNGMSSMQGPIRVSWTDLVSPPDYDCIQLKPSRIEMKTGKWNGSTCVIK